MEAEWFYLEAGQQGGPVSLDELLTLLRTRLPRGTLVWRDGLADWLAAESLPELAVKPAPPSFTAPPPPLPVHVAHGPPSSESAGSPSSATRTRPEPVSASRSTPRSAPTRASRPTEPVQAVAPDPETLNPLVLWRRSFSFGGRFGRGEFAVAHLGFMVLCLAAFLGLGAWGSVTGERPGENASLLIGLVMIGIAPVGILILLGSTVRRLR
ncbi:MAG TPA: GYF domain-containing protein, partial [Vicinamibacteria bacterium]